MVQRLVGVAFLIGSALWNSGTFAQTDPGVPSRSLQVRIITDSSRDKVVRFEYNGPAAYVRIEKIEAGAKRARHGVVVAASAGSLRVAACVGGPQTQCHGGGGKNHDNGEPHHRADQRSPLHDHGPAGPKTRFC